jgi:hypothetical protein
MQKKIATKGVKKRRGRGAEGARKEHKRRKENYVEGLVRNHANRSKVNAH